jgi:acetyltransferase-like isoleucine patch superfamily enzyme
VSTEAAWFKPLRQPVDDPVNDKQSDIRNMHQNLTEPESAAVRADGRWTIDPKRLEREHARLRRVSWRNLCGLLRWLKLWSRHRPRSLPLFFLGPRSEVVIASNIDFTAGARVRFLGDFSGRFYGSTSFGHDVKVGRGATIAVHSRLEIGDNCLLGAYSSIHDEAHVYGSTPDPIDDRGLTASPIVIGDNVWVGTKATILQGVTIGDNAVIGANAVVTRDVPANSIAAGAPARVVKTF